LPLSGTVWALEI